MMKYLFSIIVILGVIFLVGCQVQNETTSQNNNIDSTNTEDNLETKEDSCPKQEYLTDLEYCYLLCEEFGQYQQCVAGKCDVPASISPNKLRNSIENIKQMVCN